MGSTSPSRFGNWPSRHPNGGWKTRNKADERAARSAAL
jgi:hypothetical protein